MALFFIFSVNIKSQNQANLKYLSYIFSSDSLNGFDEISLNRQALQRGFFGNEYKVFMYRSKREFINAKYRYSQNPSMNSNYGLKGGNPIINAAPCVNEDFEASPVGIIAGALAGWTISEGSNTGSCIMGGCCPTFPTNNAWIRATPFACPAPLTLIPNSPLGGTQVIQMNDNIINMGEVVRITQTFPVAATNALFQFAYMAAMNGAAHACCDQPYMKVSLIDCSNNLLPCPSFSLVPPGAACVAPTLPGWTVNTSGVSFTAAWQVASIDLTPYLGSCVTIEVTVGDCDGWAHEGWAFFDAKCSPMTVTVNNIQFPIGTVATNVAACGALTATVTAPPGLGPYNWNGPAGSGVVNNTNQTFTTAVSGNYTLSMNPLGACAPITRTVNITFVPNPIPTFNVSNACTTYSFTNTGTGPPAVQTYSFVGAGAPPSFTTTATTTVVSFPPSTTYTVYHTVTNASGCVSTASVVINVPAGPNPAFTTPTYTQCLVGNSFVFTAALATGTHTFAFSPAGGAPATGFVTPYGPVNFTAAGTYTVTHTVTNAGCTTSASSVVVINPQPTVTANNNGPLCMGSNLILTATGGGTYSWSGPLGFVSALASPTIAAATPANSGVYTVTVTLLGCTSTATTNASITTPTASATNTGPYCAGTTIQLNTPAGTTYTWTGPAAFGSNLQNPTIAAATIGMGGTYTVFVTTGICTSSATTNVVVNALPTPTATNNTPVCVGAPINFTGTGATTYTWTGPGAFNSFLQNPIVAAATVANAGIYTLTVTGPTGCTNFTTTNVVVNALPIPVANNNGPLCVGNNLNLTGGGGGTYSWTGPAAFASALQNPAIPGAILANAGTYTLLVTLNTCTASLTTNVIISTATTSASNTGPYCAGSTIQLNTSPATTYTWAGPGGFASNIQNATQVNSTPAMSGTYTVMISIGTCTASATTNVVVNALPVPVANNNSPVCVGTPITFTGNGGTAYAWAGPGGFASGVQNPNIASAAVTDAGIYTLTVTDANSCTNTITTIVVVNPLPIIVVNNPTVCLNQTINLTANGGTGYTWAGPLAFASGVQNPNILNATLAMGGVYSVTVTSVAGCSNTAVSNVAVFPLPNPAITSNTPCVGSTLNLTGSGGAVYAWIGPNAFNSNSQNPNITAVTLPAAGVYTLLVTSGSCTASITSVISINPLPTPLIVSNSPVCIGQDINLSGAGGVTYSWNGPGGYNNTTQNPTITVSVLSNAGFYTLTVTDANNCVNSISAGVVVNPQPIVSATGTSVCENANANLAANGGVTYSWTGPNLFASGLQNPTVFGATIASAGQYTVLVTDANTCTNTAVANLGINPAPTPSIITNSPICINDILNLAAAGGVTYTWNGPGGFTSTSPNPTITATSVNVGGVYGVTAVSANGCVASTTINTIVNPNPTANVISGPNKGCAPLCVTFTCVSSASIQTCNWTLGDGTNPSGPFVATTCYKTTGIYSITASIIDVNGCTGSATYTAEVYPKPIADFNYAPYHPIVNNADVVFTDASFNATIAGWNWYFMSTAQYQSNVQNPTFVYTEAGEYPITLVVTSNHGCMDTAIRVIIVGEDFGIYVPNAFTPNGDGLNDVFQPKGFGIVKYALRIFDRWGEELYYTENFFQAWDGVYHGKLSQDDAYIWKINVTDVFSKAHEYTGHVTLIK